MIDVGKKEDEIDGGIRGDSLLFQPTPWETDAQNSEMGEQHQDGQGDLKFSVRRKS
jgi:hypothetical protein